VAAGGGAVTPRQAEWALFAALVILCVANWWAFAQAGNGVWLANAALGTASGAAALRILFAQVRP
jgi:hypothetical protein